MRILFGILASIKRRYNMGFLDNTSITVDAILTKKGRELLARGENAFQITKFALADDEVDYNLWDTAHPNGSSYYGAVIENMPVLEAFTDETQVMRYKLITLNKTTTQMPTLNIGIGDTTMNFELDKFILNFLIRPMYLLDDLFLIN